MKKLMLIMGIMISLFTEPVYADRTANKLEVHPWSCGSASKLGTRSPMRLPFIEVIYDSFTKSIEFVSDVDCEATVLIYDMNGNLLEASDSMDDIIYVPSTTSSVFYIRIESVNWYATATIMA